MKQKIKIQSGGITIECIVTVRNGANDEDLESAIAQMQVELNQRFPGIVQTNVFHNNFGNVGSVTQGTTFFVD